MSATLLDTLRAEMELLVAPVVAAAGDVGACRRLMAALGADDALAGDATLLGALQAAVDLETKLQAVFDAQQPSFAGVSAALDAMSNLFAALRGLDGANAQQLERLGSDIVALLCGEYLRLTKPLLYRLGTLLTIVTPIEDAGMGVVANGTVLVRRPFPCAQIQFDRIGPLIKNPEETLGAFYFPNGLATVADANAAADLLFPSIGEILTSLRVPWSYGVPDDDVAQLGDAAAFVDHAFQVWLPSTVTGSDVEAGLTLTLSSDDRGGLGLVVSPFGSLEFSTTVDAWKFDAKLGAEIEALAIGAHGATFIASADTASINASLAAALAPAASGTPAYVLGSPTGTRVEFGSVKFGIEVDASLTDVAFVASAGVSSSALVIAAGDGDSFLRAILPSGGLRVNFDLGIEYSTQGGLAFTGGAGLDATLPVAVSAGGVSLSSVHVALQAENAQLQFETSVAGAASLGPVRISVDRVGVLAVIAFPDGGGNLGVADLSFSFKPPSGLGLSIDAGAVTGGGYLGHAGDQYSGALELSVCDVAVKAFGLVETQLPGGAKGYSALVILTAEFSPGLQIGFGFTLDGVGGLLGIDRTLAMANVEAAIWSHHFDGLLFPSNPVTAAPALMAQIDSYFPAATGRYLFGPLAKIGWGAGILEVMLGLVIELPEPIKLLLVGEVLAQVPVKLPQLVLNIDFAGGIDFGQKLAFFDASLHDSHIERYPIAGDLAFRYDWGDDPVFALAIGGFNPGYQPPSNFPTLKRLSLVIGAKDVQVTGQSYLALTSNTLQFGARIEVTVGASSLNVHGFLGFDALIEWDPLLFEFDLTAGVDLRVDGSTIASVHLDGKVSGTSPWHVSGDASISLLFFDISVHVDEQWGNPAGATPAPDPIALVLAAFQDAHAWSAVVPAGVRVPVTLSGSPSDAGVAVLLEPAGGLRLTQRVAPLGQSITRFAGMPLVGAITLALGAVDVMGATEGDVATEEFALAQFEDLSDDQKLSLPAFTRYGAGLEIGGGSVDVGQSGRPRAVPTTLAYDTTIVDSIAPPRPGLRYLLEEGLQSALHARIAAAPMPAPAIQLAGDRFVVATTAGLQARADILGDGSKFGAMTALDAYVLANPAARGTLQVVAALEIA